MMPSFIRRLFTLNYKYDRIIEEQRAQRLLYIIGIILIASLAWTVFISLPGIVTGQFGIEQIATPIILVATLILYFLIQNGHLVWTSRIFVILMFLFSVGPQIDNVNTPELALLILPIVLAGVLLDRLALLLTTGLIVLIILRGALFGNTGTNLEIDMAVGIVFTVGLSAMFLNLFNSSLEQIAESADELISQTRRLGDYRNNVDTDTTQQAIVTSTINLLRSQLGFNYIRVILLDEDHKPIQTYYSSIGIGQVTETSAFPFTSNSALQQAIETASAKIITREDSGNLSAHLLASSNSGIVIPAQSFNQIIALFDIQSENTKPLTQEMIAMLDLFIRQFASDLIYHRTVNTLRDDIHDQQTIINQQGQQLQTIQYLQTEGIVTDWQSYLHQRGLNAIGYDIDSKRQISDLSKGTIPDDLRPAFEQGETIVQIQEHEQLVTIPIRFRDTTLGAISFTIPEEIPITDRKLEFIRSVTDRLALALDNKRLLEQTQIQAKREGVANEIGSILLTSTDVQTVLQTAADQFNEALGAISTQIYLQPASLQSMDNQQRGDKI